MSSIAVVNRPFPFSGEENETPSRNSLDLSALPQHSSTPPLLRDDQGSPLPRYAPPCHVLPSVHKSGCHDSAHNTLERMPPAFSAASTPNPSKTNAGDCLRHQLLNTVPLPAPKSYGTAHEPSSTDPHSSWNAAVTMHPADFTLPSLTTDVAGRDTSDPRPESPSAEREQHTCPNAPGGSPHHPPALLLAQRQHRLETREAHVRFDDRLNIMACQTHCTASVSGNACKYDGDKKSGPAPLAGDAARGPPTVERGVDEGALAAEGRPPRIVDAGSSDHSGGSAPSSSSPPPPTTLLGLVARRIETTSLLQLMWVLLLMLMLLVGNAFQVIFLNFWIHQFSASASPARHTPVPPSSVGSDGGGEGVKALASSYTTFVISAYVFPTFFLVLLLVYVLWRRPNLGFTREWAGWKLLLGIGAMDALNSIMAIYAAANTPEVLQALFISLVPIYSAIFTKWLLKDPRDYANPYIVVSFLLIATGVAIASLFNYAATHHHDTKNGSGGGPPSSPSPSSSVALDRRLWCLVFFLSVPPTVLMNVWQTMYMIRYTSTDHPTESLADHAESVAEGEEDGEVGVGEEDGEGEDGEEGGDHTVAPVPTQPLAGSASASFSGMLMPPKLPLHGDDTSVKLVMLTSDTAIQAIMALMLLPVDALPWFGGSNSIREVVQNLEEGIDCVLHCPHNMTYCILYSIGFVLVYIASAYLNRYSVTLCSMVSQLSGPITALILIAFPALNMTGDSSPWYVSIFAIIVLSCGTVIYVYWDEMTMEEKMVGEVQLKWTMLQEQQQQRGPHLHLHPSGRGPSYHAIDNGSPTAARAQHHRHSRSRRYRRRAQSHYVVVVNQDVTDTADNQQSHPH